MKDPGAEPFPHALRAVSAGYLGLLRKKYLENRGFSNFPTMFPRGTYAAFLKSWDRRALKPMRLEHGDIFDNKKENKAFRADANELVVF